MVASYWSTKIYVKAVSLQINEDRVLYMGPHKDNATPEIWRHICIILVLLNLTGSYLTIHEYEDCADENIIYIIIAWQFELH